MTIDSTKTMSTREIAKLTGKDHSHILRDTRKMLSDLDPDNPFMDGIDFKGISVIKREDNGQTSEIMLPKRESMILVSGYNIKMRAAIIDRWQELEALVAEPPKPALPDFTNPVIAARAWADEVEAKQVALIALEEAKPKVEFVDNYVDSEGCYNFTQVCKMLGAKQKELRDMLQNNRIMYKTNGTWTPYADHMHNENFVVKTGTSPGGFSYALPYFTPKGFAHVSKLWRLENAPAFRRK